MKVRTASGTLALVLLVAGTLWLGSGAAAAGWPSAVVLAVWVGVLVATVWHWLRAVSFWRQLPVWGAFLTLLVGMVLPPELLQVILHWLADRFGQVPGVEVRESVQAWGHIGLYAAFAGALFWARGGNRFATRWLLPLAGFAVATELMQLLVHGRHANAVDVLFNLAGIAGAAVIAWTSEDYRALRHNRIGYRRKAWGSDSRPDPAPDRAVGAEPAGVLDSVIELPRVRPSQAESRC